MNLRINPEELTPRPGARFARARILSAGEAYQATRPPVIVDKHADKEAAELSALLAKALIEAMDNLQVADLPAEDARTIVREVAKKHGLAPAHLRGISRRAIIVRGRQEAYYRLYTECPDLSMPQIGRYLGGRDHTTVLHGIRAHAALFSLPVPKRDHATNCALGWLVRKQVTA